LTKTYNNFIQNYNPKYKQTQSTNRCGPIQGSRYSESQRDERSGDWNQVGARSYRTRPDRPCGPPIPL